jgi:hypothetical protein
MATCHCRFHVVYNRNLNSKGRRRIKRWIGIMTRLIATSRDVLGEMTRTKGEDNTLDQETTEIMIGRVMSEDVLKVMMIADHREVAMTMNIGALGTMRTKIVDRHVEAGAGPAIRKAMPKRRGGAGTNGNPTAHASGTKMTTIETAAVVVMTRRAGVADGAAIPKDMPKQPGAGGKNVGRPGAVRQTTMTIGGDPGPTKTKAADGMEIPEVTRKPPVEVGTSANRIPAAGTMTMMTAEEDIKAMRGTADGMVTPGGIRKPPGAAGGIVIGK